MPSKDQLTALDARLPIFGELEIAPVQPQPSSPVMVTNAPVQEITVLNCGARSWGTTNYPQLIPVCYTIDAAGKAYADKAKEAVSERIRYAIQWHPYAPTKPRLIVVGLEEMAALNGYEWDFLLPDKFDDIRLLRSGKDSEISVF